MYVFFLIIHKVQHYSEKTAFLAGALLVEKSTVTERQ